jgi:hypothetical protein
LEWNQHGAATLIKIQQDLPALVLPQETAPEASFGLLKTIIAVVQDCMTHP